MTSSSQNQISIIKQFIENNGGIQRANRYSIEFSLPQGIYANSSNAREYSESARVLYPSAVSFGGRAINYVYDNLQGTNYGRAIPNSSKYVAGIILTFLVTGNLKILKDFNYWMDYIYYKPYSGTGARIANWYSNIISDNFKINFLNLNGEVTNYIYFREVYPVECMPLELSAKSDAPLLYQVVLNYREMVPIIATGI